VETAANSSCGTLCKRAGNRSDGRPLPRLCDRNVDYVHKGHDLDEPPGIVPGAKAVLQPGMTIVLHPSAMDKNGDGIFIGNSYVITKAGYEPLTMSVGT
jgi:hypothetical protein